LQIFSIEELRKRVMVLFGYGVRHRNCAPYLKHPNKIDYREDLEKIVLMLDLDPDFKIYDQEWVYAIAEVVAKKQNCGLELLTYPGTEVNRWAFTWSGESVNDANVIATTIFQYNRGISYVLDHSDEIVQLALIDAGCKAALFI
jgi:hypothetical protein